MDEGVKQFIESKHVAVIGASARRTKFGGAAYRSLKKRGYNVYPVNPNAETVDGDRCYPNLLLLPDEVDAAVVIIPPEKAFGLIDKARQKDIKVLWFQQGADFSELAGEAEEAGIRVVKDKCVLMYAPPVKGIHGIHRFLAKTFGKL